MVAIKSVPGLLTFNHINLYALLLMEMQKLLRLDKKIGSRSRRNDSSLLIFAVSGSDTISQVRPTGVKKRL